jgi:hypothetical protein
MLHVIQRHWLRLRGKPQLVVVLRVKDQAEPIHVGETLVDEAGNEFKLEGVGHIRYATDKDTDKHQNEFTVTLVPVKDGTEPLATLQKKPTYRDEGQAGDTANVPTGGDPPE